MLRLIVFFGITMLLEILIICLKLFNKKIKNFGIELEHIEFSIISGVLALYSFYAMLKVFSDFTILNYLLFVGPISIFALLLKWGDE